MRAIAEGWGCRAFASAEEITVGRLDLDSERCEPTALVRAVAIGLVLALAASAPELELAGFEFDLVRRLLGHDGLLIGHFGDPPSFTIAKAQVHKNSENEQV
jgi:hypothetical protein